MARQFKERKKVGYLAQRRRTRLRMDVCKAGGGECVRRCATHPTQDSAEQMAKRPSESAVSDGLLATMSAILS
ncbi:hypothetical protein [Kingella potus]|uniref:hypothetical protein n=1 Tax=Kingella potus TaxID=265175 RepID=UPI001FD567C8|nr:hypothetical protein [Kingella potus]UOP00715.1 hypothetical protein LVJ84_13135 [Kingella potus]